MTAPPLTDLDLVRGLHARDRKSLARVYGDHHAGIYNLCARILGDREEAQDVTQEVFLKAFATPPAATGDVKLRAWLYRVATNTCLNVVRRRRGQEGDDVELVASRVDPYEQARSAALIEGSLAAINERYRAALVLKDLHGLGGEELAEVLEVSRPAADVLVHRARAAFRRAFSGLAGEDAVAPANLAVALPVLAVPAALQALPMLPDAASQGAGPAAGLLAKLAAALGTKAAVVVAGAAVVAGGGVAAVQLAGGHTTPAPAATPGTQVLVGTVPARLRGAAYDAHAAWGGDHHAIAMHETWGHGSGHDAGEHSAGHHAAGHEATGHDAGGSSHTAGSQDAAAHEASGSATSGPTTTHTHDGGDGSTHDGGGGD